MGQQGLEAEFPTAQDSALSTKGYFSAKPEGTLCYEEIPELVFNSRAHFMHHSHGLSLGTPSPKTEHIFFFLFPPSSALLKGRSALLKGRLTSPRLREDVLAWMGTMKF